MDVFTTSSPRPHPRHKEGFNLIKWNSFWMKQPWLIQRAVSGHLSVCLSVYLLLFNQWDNGSGQRSRAKYRLHMGHCCHGPEPTTPAGWTGGNTDILLLVGQCTGNITTRWHVKWLSMQETLRSMMKRGHSLNKKCSTYVYFKGAACGSGCKAGLPLVRWLTVWLPS